MAFQVSPGINVTEVDLTTIVPAVATTIGGIAGYYEWGPADRVVLVDSPKTYRETFGDPTPSNYEQWFTGVNFLGYGRSLLVARRTHDQAKNAVSQPVSHETLGWTGGTAGEWITNRYIANSSGLTSSDYYGVFAKYPGEKGNSLKVSMFLGGESAGAYDNWTWYKDQKIIGEPPFVSGSDNLSRLVSGGIANDLFHFVVIDEDGLFTGAKNTVLERYPNLSLFPQSRSDNGSTLYYKSIINTNSRYVFVGGDELPSDPIMDFERNFGLTSDAITVTETYKVTYAGLTFPQSSNSSGLTSAYAFDLSLGGGTGSYGNNSDLASTVGGNSAKGYNLFEDTENVNVSLIMAGNIHDASTLGYLKAIVEERKDCVLFVTSENKDDSKTENEKKNSCLEAKNRVGSSSYVFIDSGYKFQYDPYNDRNRWIPMNGDIAGLVARTDFTNDPWFSPAGLNRGQVRNTIKLAFNPSQTFRDVIYPKGINPVISVPGEGTILFGDRTALSKPSAFDRINVRRLFIVLEKAISAASKYSLFEFNDAFTRQQFRSLIEPFLRDVKARRGIFDWKVVCDETNNTPEMIDRNEFAADIYIKPTRTINFIQLNFVATRTGVSFDEVGA